MKNILTLLVICALACSACEPMIDQVFDIYYIRQGEHYTSKRHVEFLNANILRFEVRFDSSAIYMFDQAGFQDSKNKLIGFSDCNSMHHENSARFAWQWYHNKIELYAYCYRDGVREEQYLGAMNPGEVARGELEAADGEYIFRFKETEVRMSRSKSNTPGAYLMLWPYFGGQLPAPHDVSIYLKRF